MIRKKNSQNNNTELTFSDHLSELKSRLIYIFISFLVFSCVGYYFRLEIIEVLISPLKQKLFFTSPTGAFEFTIQVSLLFGFFLTIPVIIYNLIGYLEPLFTPKIHKIINFIIIFSCIFLVLGILSAYLIFIPFTLNFLLSFDPQLESIITTKEYMSFITFYLVTFAIIFQMPLLILLISFVFPVSVKTLMSYQRVVIAASFLVAAFLTPTFDILNQVIVAVPIIAIYQVSILFVWIFKKNLLEKK